MKRMFTVPANYSLGKPSSGDIMIQGCFAIKLPDGTIEYDNGTGTVALYTVDRAESNAQDGIKYNSFFKTRPNSVGMALTFETKPTVKPELYFDLYTTKYRSDLRPNISITGYIDTTRDTDSPMVVISYNDGIMQIADVQTPEGSSDLVQNVHTSESWDLSKDQGPKSFRGQLGKYGLVYDEAASNDEGELLFKFPPESYKLLGDGTIQLNRNAIPEEFFDHVKFQLYACPLERILY